MSEIVSNRSIIRKDVQAAWFGIGFAVLFSALVWWGNQYLNDVILLEDQGASWYYWKLPEPTFWTRASAWGGYLAHQLTLWGLIYYAQTRVRKYADGLHKINYLALGLNAFFILLHFAQTQFFYDGIAQDVSIWSSQVSVAILLIWVLLMENRRRGLFFGKPAPISKQIIRFARKYHGYFFAWATVYTFWYHPMVFTTGHIVGFFYMFLLLLQGSLFLTRIHINRWWMLFQEVLVLIHGTIVAIMQGNQIWPMFAFGFGGVFVITQMHGLGLKSWVRYLVIFTYIIVAGMVYNQRGWPQLNEIIRIPLIDYLAVFVLAGILGLVMWIVRKVKGVTQAKDVL
jgi:hypothetical protein